MTTIKLKRSSSTGVAPGTADLELGELAVNTFDGKLFLKKNDGSDSIVEFNPTSATGSSIVVNDSDGLSDSAFLIDYNVSGDTPVLTGDILKRGLFIDVDSSANMGTVDNEHRLYGAVIDVRNTGDSDVVNGLRVFQQNNHTAGTTTISRGIASEISNQASGTGTVTDIYGFYGITNQASVNAVNEIAGLKLQTNSLSTGTGGGTTISGADIELQRNGGSWTNAYGIKVLVDENNNNSDAPAVTNSYLIHASYEGVTTATNEWGLYLPDTAATNFFGGPVQLDGPVQITDTTAAAQTGEGALQVTGGASFDSWVFFDIAGSNVVYDADASSRQVFDIRRNNDNQWLLTLNTDGDLVFDVNNTNNPNGQVDFFAPVQFFGQIQGEVDINVAGSNLVLNSDASTRQTIDWRVLDSNYWYAILKPSDGSLEFQPNNTNNPTGRLDVSAPLYQFKNQTVVDNNFLASNSGITINHDLSGNTALTADRVGYGLYVDMDSSFDNSNSSGNDLWLEGIRSDVRFTTSHEYARGMRTYIQANNSSGTLVDLTGYRNQSVFNGSGTADVQNIYGSFNEASHNSAIDITGNLFGMRNIVSLFTASGGANNIYGTYSETQFSGNALNDIFGVYALIDNNGTGGNATGDAYAFYSRYEGNLPATGAGKNYGIYVTDQTGVENFIGGDLTTFSDDIRVEGDTIQNAAGGQFVFDSDTATRTVMRFDQNNLPQWFWQIDNLGKLAFNYDTTNNPNAEIDFYSKVRNRSTFTNTGDILGLTANKFSVIKHSQANFVYTTNTVTGTDGAFSGFEAGETIDIRSSTNNDGQYTIQSIGDSGADTNNVLTITANSFTAGTDTATGFITQEKLGISYDNDAVALSLYINTAGDETSINQFPDSYGFNAHFSSGSFETFAYRRDFTLHKSESIGATPGGLWVQEYNSSTGDQLGFDRIFTDSYGGIAEVTTNGNTTTNDLTVGSITSTNHATINGVEIGKAGGTTSVTNLAIGPAAGVGRPLEQFTSANNVGIGYEALENNVDGFECVAVGRGALQDNVNGQRNTAFGHQALRDNGTGGGNAFGSTAIGWQASVSNTSGINNVSLGYAALQGNTTANNNTAVGFRALDSAGIGDDNTAIGYSSLTALSSGAQNVVVGSGAGTNLTGGSNNTIVGYNAEPSSATASNEITLGDTNVTYFRVPGVNVYADSEGIGVGITDPQANLHTSTTGENASAIYAQDSDGWIRLIPNFGAGGFNPKSGAGDMGIAFSPNNDATVTSSDGFIIVPWDADGAGGFKVADDGNVKIGSINGGAPDKALVVEGAGAEVVINDTDTTDTPRLRLRESGTTSGTVYTDASSMYFTTGSTDRVRISSSDGRIVAPGGIQLGTPDFSDSNVNTLDDYEEGTWTPSYILTAVDFASITMEVLSATYTKIGDTVTIKCWIRTDAVDITGSSGNLRISGLPFTISGYGGLSIGRSESWTNNVNAGHLVGGTTEIRLYKRTSISAQDNPMTSADMVTGTVANQNNLVFTAIYRTT